MTNQSDNRPTRNETNLRKFEIGIELVACGGEKRAARGGLREERTRERQRWLRDGRTGWRGTFGWRRSEGRAASVSGTTYRHEPATTPLHRGIAYHARQVQRCIHCRCMPTDTLVCLRAYARARACVCTPSVIPGVHDTTNVIQMMNNSWTNGVKGWIVLATRDSVQLAFYSRAL